MGVGEKTKMLLQNWGSVSIKSLSRNSNLLLNKEFGESIKFRIMKKNHEKIKKIQKNLGLRSALGEMTLNQWL
jgi:hypothetical protein